MSETFLAILAIAMIFVVIPVSILLIRDRIKGIRDIGDARPPLAERPAVERRLLRPDWGAAECQLNRRVPDALRDLYADHALITRQDLTFSDHTISTFEPLDVGSFGDGHDWVGFETLPIATTDMGDLVYLRPGSAEADTVYVTYVDGNDTEVFAESVEQFLMEVRAQN